MSILFNELFQKKLIDRQTFLDFVNVEDPIQNMYEYFKKNNKNIQDLINVIINVYNIQYVDLSKIEVSKDIFNTITNNISSKYNIFCIDKKDNHITVVTNKPITDMYIYNNLLSEIYPYTMDIKFAFKKEIEDMVLSLNKTNTLKKEEISTIDKNEDISIDPKETMKKVNDIINKGILLEASDIHLEPINENNIRVRYRIDGDLITISDVKIYIKEYANIVSRIKVLAGLDPSERRKSQDGKIANYTFEKEIFDLRVSSMSTIYGEKIVIRLIKKITNNMNLETLGFSQSECLRMSRLLSKKNGIIFLTGQTGSGKSTTVYTMLNMLNTENVNICTVEDPVESEIPGIFQVQVNELADITFASALRTFLRQDPDIISVGEIRDLVTADIAIKAANTGHLVLSTIHTNNTTSTINRLISMGIESYKISEGVIGIVSQRLVKKLCPYCKKEHILTDIQKDRIGKTLKQFDLKDISEYKFFKPNILGCPHCNKGYKGRIVIPEILEFNEKIDILIAQKLNSVELRNKILKDTDIFLPFEKSVFDKIEDISIDTLKQFL